VTNIIDAANNKIEYAYNDLGQTIAMADPDLGYWQYIRDYAGRLKDQIDAKGQRTRFSYNDALGRLKSKDIYNTSGALAYTVTYTYDTGISGYTVYKGQLGSVTDFEGTERYSYDVRGRTLKNFRQLSVNNKSYTNEFTFDSADRLASVKYTHGGPTVTNLYDAGGNLLKVQHASGTPVYFTAKGYNDLSQLLGINLGNGTESTFSFYAKTRRLQSILSKQTSAATNFQNLSYTYNQVADLTAITDSIFTNGTNSASLSSIAYDNLHRLTSLTRPGPLTTTFAYDRIGNITSNGEEGGSAYTYNSNGLLAHAVKTVGTKKYAYDLCGNMVHRNGQALGYDPENRLSSVIKNGLAVGTFGYSHDGERLWKLATNTLHIWIDRMFESRGTTNLYHIFAGMRRVATYSPAVKLPGASGNTDYHYYHPDHLGSSSLITDATGALAEHYEYTAYGRERANGSAAPDASHRFTGQIFDQDTGLYYYGARYYDQDIARFIQPDTIEPHLGEPQRWNRYSYVLNNPLKYVDPTGHYEDLGSGIWIMKDGYVAGPGLNLAEKAYVNYELAYKQGDAIRQHAYVEQLRPYIENSTLIPPALLLRMIASGADDPQGTSAMLGLAALGIPSGNRAPVGPSRSVAPSRQQPSPKGEITESVAPPTPKGSANPNTRSGAIRGSQLHADRPGNLPDQLRNKYPETQFEFTKPGIKGQDVTVKGGKHPSEYPGSKWPKNANRADFKPDTDTGRRTFRQDQRSKWNNESTYMLPYNPKTGKIEE